MQQPIDFVIRAATDETAATLREYAARRLSFALRRFRHRVRRVKVRLIDLNGPRRRGIDSRCSMTVELVDGGLIVAEATTAWPFASVRARPAASRKPYVASSGEQLRAAQCRVRPDRHVVVNEPWRTVLRQLFALSGLHRSLSL